MYIIFLQDPNTREYLQLALARVLELQREVREGTYIAEIDNSNDQGNANFSRSSFFSQALHNLYARYHWLELFKHSEWTKMIYILELPYEILIKVHFLFPMFGELLVLY